MVASILACGAPTALADGDGDGGGAGSDGGSAGSDGGSAGSHGGGAGSDGSSSGETDGGAAGDSAGPAADGATGDGSIGSDDSSSPGTDEGAAESGPAAADPADFGAVSAPADQADFGAVSTPADPADFGAEDVAAPADPSTVAAPSDVEAALAEQAAYAQSQWGLGTGIVGPRGSEENGLFAGFNNPANPGYTEAQSFAYQHDLQATEAQFQDAYGNYGLANAVSATIGMAVTAFTGDPDLGAQAAQATWGAFGYDVASNYGPANAPAGTPSGTGTPSGGSGSGGDVVFSNPCGYVTVDVDSRLVDVNIPGGAEGCSTDPGTWTTNPLPPPATPAPEPARPAPSDGEVDEFDRICRRITYCQEP